MSANASIDTPSTFQRRLTWLMLAFAVASLIHFIHNAEFIMEYPGLPKNWTTNGVYGAWLVMTFFGFTSWWVTRTKLKTLGLILVMLYAVCGLDSLGHYWVAPIYAHQTMMNVTILLEVFCALVLFLYAGFYFLKSRR
jgi:hypothetical protein